ncbi:hypothetical protein GCM10022223_10870 [Kineosporia mesophila]|uniref:Secreted protein n=1 Tax=Kineosporia mesophila TaxID=566012 RepID=A0ABP6Z651_9ACTN|nr:hypothetical protein [Kineosporia mesophila]MCD5352566.1 hypothetical protein [Kineosporia mesophila]
MSHRPAPDGESLLSLRTTVILIVGVFGGVLVGVLTIAAGSAPAAAVLAALPAAGGTVLGLHRLVEKSHPPG